MSTQNKQRIGFVGTGGIADMHMQHYLAFDDVEIVGACDIVPGRARAFLDKYKLSGAPAFENVNDMIKNVQMDGADVCTFHTTHAECTVALLEAGVHVMCEKPMSFKLDEAVEMVRASRKANKMLSIGFQPRFDPIRRMVDSIIESGALGKVYYVQSGGGRRRGIPAGNFVDADKSGYGCLGDIGCYSIDQCLHAIRYPKPLTVSAVATDYFGKNPKHWPDPENFNVDDFSVAFVRMEGDVTFVFKQSWAMHADSLGDTLWLGTDGGLKVTTAIREQNKPSQVIYYTDINGNHLDSVVTPDSSWVRPRDKYKDAWHGKMRSFVDALYTNGPAPVPGEEILYNQAICDGIYRSSQLKREVEIIIPEI